MWDKSRDTHGSVFKLQQNIIPSIGMFLLF